MKDRRSGISLVVIIPMCVLFVLFRVEGIA